MIESIRQNDPAVLLLDGGVLFDNYGDKADLLVKAMQLMGYDALNLGSTEFFFGKEFLEHTHAHVSFPYIASNLLDGGGRLPWTREYVIKEVGGLRVAILGILDPDGLAQLPNKEQVKELQVIPPETVLNRLISEVKEKADLVILLSQFGAEKTQALVKAVHGIDVAISSGGDDLFFSQTQTRERPILLHTRFLGKTMGLLKITLDEKQTLSVTENRHVTLDNSVPNNEQVARLVENFKKDKVKKEASLVEKQRKELMEGLQLSPEEFVEQYRKEQAEKKRGGAR